MGTSNYACGITNVAISSGDPVLQVVCLDGRLKDVYELRQALMRFRSESENNRVLFGGTKMTPEEIAQAALELATESFNRDLIVRFGTYDNAGWIEEHERGELHPYRIPNFMVSRPIAEQIAREAGVSSVSDALDVLKPVLDFMHVCRLNPFATLVGLQGFDRIEMDYHLKRIELIQRALESKEKYWLDDYEED